MRDELRIVVYYWHHYWRNYRSTLLRLKPYNDMFKVISDIMEQWYDMINSFIITINFCNAKKMNCALMFIMRIRMDENVLVN